MPGLEQNWDIECFWESPRLGKLFGAPCTEPGSVTAELDPHRWIGQRAGREGKESVCGPEAAGLSGKSPPDAGQGECPASAEQGGRGASC